MASGVREFAGCVAAAPGVAVLGVSSTSPECVLLEAQGAGGGSRHLVDQAYARAVASRAVVRGAAGSPMGRAGDGHRPAPGNTFDRSQGADATVTSVSEGRTGGVGVRPAHSSESGRTHRHGSGAGSVRQARRGRATATVHAVIVGISNWSAGSSRSHDLRDKTRVAAGVSQGAGCVSRLARCAVVGLTTSPTGGTLVQAELSTGGTGDPVDQAHVGAIARRSVGGVPTGPAGGRRSNGDVAASTRAAQQAEVRRAAVTGVARGGVGSAAAGTASRHTCYVYVRGSRGGPGEGPHMGRSAHRGIRGARGAAAGATKGRGIQRDRARTAHRGEGGRGRPRRSRGPGVRAPTGPAGGSLGQADTARRRERGNVGQGGISSIPTVRAVNAGSAGTTGLGDARGHEPPPRWRFLSHSR